MKRVTVTSFLTVLLAAASMSASAVPVHATFNGAVTGSTNFFTQVLNDFPAGTTASFDVTFDDSGIVPSMPVADLDLAPVSGWLRLGSLEWLLDAGSIWTYTYMNTPDMPVQSYGLQITGTGPTIGGNASLFGLFVRLAPDLSAFGPNPLMAGFAFPVESGEFYSYADLAGSFNISRGSTTVAEPSMLFLMIGALALLLARRRFLRPTGFACATAA